MTDFWVSLSVFLFISVKAADFPPSEAFRTLCSASAWMRGGADFSLGDDRLRVLRLTGMLTECSGN